MDRDEILQLSGRELDIEVEYIIFGHVADWFSLYISDDGIHEEMRRGQDGDCPGPCWVDEHGGILRAVPTYSTDIATAWRVVDRMNKTPWHFNLMDKRKDGLWLCEYSFADGTLPNAPDYLEELSGKYTVLAETAPLAICRAALIATLDYR